MPAILFNNVWMLAGLAALSIPVLIHLLLRRKRKRVRFSTIQFFAKQDEQASQRRRLRNWILLCLRLLIVGLLVLAFARPYWAGAGAGGAGQGKRQVVIVLDRSLSMQANAADGPKWPRARESVHQILGELKPDDRAALVGCAASAEVLSAWAPSALVNKIVMELEPTCGAANLGNGLEQARKLLSTGDSKAASEIYVVSDLQRTSCPDLAAYPVPPGAQIKVLNIGDLVTPNLAIADLQLEPTDGQKPHVVLASFSDEDNPALQLDLKLDGKAVETQTVALSAGAVTNLELSLPRLKPGWHDAVVQLRGGHDALSQDNVRFQSMFVPEPTHVLIAEGRPDARSFDQESFFALTALDPGHGSTNSVQSQFACETMIPDDLARRLAAHQEGSPCAMVILPGLKEMSFALGLALKSYVEAGGGLMLFVGEGVSAIHYNAQLKGLLPAELDRLESSPVPEAGWRIGDYSTNSPLFSVFQVPNSGDLSLPRFTKRFSLARANAGTLAACFNDGAPFIVTQTVGRGRVVLVNTSVDTTWSDWPKHKTFVPWLHATSHYLAGLTPSEKIQSQTSLLAGAEDDVELGTAAAKSTFTLTPPTGKEIRWTADDQGDLRNILLASPGIYSLRDSHGKERRRIAVNVPSQESDLTAIAPADFMHQLAQGHAEGETKLRAGLFGSTSNQRELWRVLLLAVLVLLFLEMLVANRTLA
jgi:hypothetical protein